MRNALRKFTFSIHRIENGINLSITMVGSLFFLIVALTACQSSAVVKNTESKGQTNTIVVQESGKPITYQDMIKRFDTNKDGILDDNEIEQVQKSLGTRQPTFTQSTSDEQTIRRALILPGKSDSKSEDPILNKYDLNRDGILDENEINLLKNDLKSGVSTTTKPIKTKKQSTVVTTPIKTKRNPIVR
ncbi:MAG: hypothetical protein N2487_00750 [Verrucomicrobiae bacterium]|nr:hypothetical protein [Verrucomicrobiae bacterium]